MLKKKSWKRSMSGGGMEKEGRDGWGLERDGGRTGAGLRGGKVSVPRRSPRTSSLNCMRDGVVGLGAGEGEVCGVGNAQRESVGVFVDALEEPVGGQVEEEEEELEGESTVVDARGSWVERSTSLRKGERELVRRRSGTRKGGKLHVLNEPPGSGYVVPQAGASSCTAIDTVAQFPFVPEQRDLDPLLRLDPADCARPARPLRTSSIVQTLLDNDDGTCSSSLEEYFESASSSSLLVGSPSGDGRVELGVLGEGEERAWRLGSGGRSRSVGKHVCVGTGRGLCGAGNGGEDEVDREGEERGWNAEGSELKQHVNARNGVGLERDQDGMRVGRQGKVRDGPASVRVWSGGTGLQNGSHTSPGAETLYEDAAMAVRQSDPNQDWADETVVDSLRNNNNVQNNHASQGLGDNHVFCQSCRVPRVVFEVPRDDGDRAGSSTEDGVLDGYKRYRRPNDDPSLLHGTRTSAAPPSLPMPQVPLASSCPTLSPTPDAAADAATTPPTRRASHDLARRSLADAYNQKAIALHESGKLTTSFEYFSLAASMNSPSGLFLYGMCLRHGWGCKPDLRRSFENLSKAARAAVLELPEGERRGAGVWELMQGVEPGAGKGLGLAQARAVFWPARVGEQEEEQGQGQGQGQGQEREQGQEQGGAAQAVGLGRLWLGSRVQLRPSRSGLLPGSASTERSKLPIGLSHRLSLRPKARSPSSSLHASPFQPPTPSPTNPNPSTNPNPTTTTTTTTTTTPPHELPLIIYELAQSYLHGWGVPRSKPTAAFYTELSASLGDPDAQTDIALFYRNGDGVKKDKLRAAKYFRMAENQGRREPGNSWIWKEKYDRCGVKALERA